MEIGRCPRCTTPYSASEIAGFGILRARTARSGGPRMEYSCQSCDRLIHLIPHGEGRYAPPGQPPPAFVPEEERRPPWVEGAPPPPVSRDPFEEPLEPLPEEPDPGPEPSPRPDPDAVDPGAPMSAAQALALLGIPPTAGTEAIERAFRERSLTCHPDKVAHLDPEFQELAERKFKRLQKAYELLLS